MPEVINITKLNVIYAPKTPLERHALKNINLSIKEGEYRALIGPQGSGKSTLLQVMAGLIPGEGKVIITGQDMADKKNRVHLWRKVGVIFQYPERQLFEDTVFNDVAFGPANMGFSEEETKRRVFEALSSVGLDQQYHQVSPYKLSGGQQRRAAIAGILAMEPEILLLDEPTAGLDPRGQQQLMNLFSDLCKKHKITIVLVTHDMEEVAHRADRVTILKQGEVYLEGIPSEIFSQTRGIENIGLAVPFANELSAALREKGFAVKENITTLQEIEKEIHRLLVKPLRTNT